MAAAQAGKKVIISLGSTVINFGRTQVLDNLRELCRGDNLVIFGHQGPDGVTGPDGDQVHHDAYHTKQFKDFMWKGLLETGNEILRKTVFTDREWDIKCKIRHRPWRHQFVFHYEGKERFQGFVSIKYHEHEIASMIEEAGAPSPEIYRHPETAMRVYVVDCANRNEFVLPVDIVYIRHCESGSNIRGIKSGFDLRTYSEEQTRRFITDAINDKGVHIFNGDYCKDGLTSEGQKQAAQKLPYPLDHVKYFVSSPCTRPFQSSRLVVPSFNMTESQAGKAGKPVIHIDRRLREATSWPQDFEPLLKREGGRVYASYLEVKGGNDHDAGRVVGETEVDFTDAIWREDGTQRTLHTMDARMEALEYPETLREAKQRFTSFLKDEVIAAKANYQEHTESGKEGTPKRVWMGHGGALNLLEDKYHCEYTQGADGCWEWKSSAALGYGEVRVFNLCVDGDGAVALKEKPWDNHYAKVFGSRYRHFGSDLSLQYRHPDGSLVDQEKDYEAFFSRARNEVVKVVQEKRTALSVLQGWEAS
ncbi:hypothetical protein QQZ08_010793 [Neonectria magnoliae]|uniref:Uncharacterized protein n=1 Tax=Neonectria magnoliae TaxID=2732573 RepID=A0ABR1HEM4_9HYPO